MNEPIPVLLVDDHPLLRRGLASYLNTLPDIRVVADVGDGRSAVLEVERHAPRVVVLDIDMQGQLAFPTAAAIASAHPRTRVIFLSAICHDRYLDEALRVTRWGYLTKTEPPDAVARAIRSVDSGLPCYSDEVRARLLFSDEDKRVSSRASSLTSRELEVLRYVGAGHSQKEIAQMLFLSVKTVENHVSRMMAKLDLHDRVALARFAIREGFAKA